MIQRCHVIMYADDVVFYTVHWKLSITTDTLQRDVTKVDSWFSKSGLCKMKYKELPDIRTNKLEVISWCKGQWT